MITKHAVEHGMLYGTKLGGKGNTILIQYRYMIWEVYQCLVCQASPCNEYTNMVTRWHQYGAWHQDGVSCCRV